MVKLKQSSVALTVFHLFPKENCLISEKFRYYEKARKISKKSSNMFVIYLVTLKKLGDFYKKNSFKKVAADKF